MQNSQEIDQYMQDVAPLLDQLAPNTNLGAAAAPPAMPGVQQPAAPQGAPSPAPAAGNLGAAAAPQGPAPGAAPAPAAAVPGAAPQGASNLGGSAPGQTPGQPGGDGQPPTSFRDLWHGMGHQDQTKYLDQLEKQGVDIDASYKRMSAELGQKPSADLTRNDKGMLLMEFGLSLMANSSGGAYGKDVGGAAGAAGQQTLQMYQQMHGNKVAAQQQYLENEQNLAKGQASAVESNARLHEAVESRQATEDWRASQMQNANLAAHRPIGSPVVGADGTQVQRFEDGSTQVVTDPRTGQPLKADMRMNAAQAPKDLQIENLIDSTQSQLDKINAKKNLSDADKTQVQRLNDKLGRLQNSAGGRQGVQNDRVTAGDYERVHSANMRTLSSLHPDWNEQQLSDSANQMTEGTLGRARTFAGGGNLAPAAPTIPPIQMLKPNVHTRFKNGQVWTIGPDGKPQQVQ